MTDARDTTFLKMFIEVTKAITSSVDTDEVFKLIAQKIPQVVGVDAATIRVLDGSGRKLVLKAAGGVSQSYLERGTIDTEEPVFKALQGEPIFIEDAPNDPRINYPEETAREGIKSILVVPIPIRGSVNGILRLLTRKPRRFSQDEIAFAAALGEQCGIAIENARIFKEQQTQLKYFKAIYEIGRAIKETSDLQKILNLIVTRLPDVMNLKAATIRLFDPQKGKLELMAAYGLSRTYLERGPLDEELATFFVREGEPVVIPDATKDIHTIYHKEAGSEGISSILAVPIIVEEETIGILRLLSSEVRYFTAADINFSMAVAEQGGVAIQRTIDQGKL